MGNSAPDWSAREDLEVIAYWNENFDRQQGNFNPPGNLSNLPVRFGTALRFKFSLGGREYLDLSQPITQADLDQFKVNTQYAVTLIFDIQIDKVVPARS